MGWEEYRDQHHSEFNRQGEPITTGQWSALMEDWDYKRVASTEIGPYWVSTVWIGLDHNFLGNGPPIIFETMVFSKDERDDPNHVGLRDIDMQRYSTEEAALAGHEEMCLLVRAVLQDEIPTMEGSADGEDHRRQEDLDRDDHQEPGGAPGPVPEGSGEVPGEGDRSPRSAPCSGPRGQED